MKYTQEQKEHKEESWILSCTLKKFKLSSREGVSWKNKQSHKFWKKVLILKLKTSIKFQSLFKNITYNIYNPQTKLKGVFQWMKGGEW